MARPHLATFPAMRVAEGMALIEECCEVIQAANVLETTLMNVNCVIHPLPAVLNWGWIEARENQISLYGEGMTPGVLACVERLDAERCAIASAMGMSALPLDDTYRAWQIPPLYRLKMTIGSAERYEERFLLEDVPVGLVTLADLGAQFDVPTPLADATIALASAIHGRDLRLNGRTAASLGIAGMDLPQLKSYLQTGTA
jgi:opine dehydrogenase